MTHVFLLMMHVSKIPTQITHLYKLSPYPMYITGCVQGVPTSFSENLKFARTSILKFFFKKIRQIEVRSALLSKTVNKL